MAYIGVVSITETPTELRGSLRNASKCCVIAENQQLSCSLIGNISSSFNFKDRNRKSRRLMPDSKQEIPGKAPDLSEGSLCHPSEKPIINPLANGGDGHTMLGPESIRT